MRPRMSSYGVSFTANSHGNRSSLLCAMALFPVFIGIGLNQDQYWTPYRSYSLVTGVASIGLFIAFSVAVLASFHYVGLLQRFFLAAPFQWIGIMATRLRYFAK